MGVSGCGKSALGARIAAHWGLSFIEGDEFHSPASIEKMRAGEPLTDADRADWLIRLADELARRPSGAVLSCSALKKSYRDCLRAGAAGLGFVYLELDEATSLARVQSRGSHFFPAALVANQFATLESPTREAGVLTLDAREPLDALVSEVVRTFSSTADEADQAD